ncbi:hypothetical protein [Mesorhizobium qingshengii]|uniref:hypothetical protein n=1 Tax=Mesorhizobium qingshengii TaxID=1165689 RepID=UPI001428CA33|nr:hypothetical protein [Mesorhizobium qingshengii]
MAPAIGLRLVGRHHQQKSLRTILNLDACQFFLKHAEMLAGHPPALWEEQCLT